jgi:hypothetical protein
MVRRVRNANDGMARLSLADFKALVRDQFLILLAEPTASLAAIPSMLPPEAQPRERALDLLRKVLSSHGQMDGETAERMKRVEALFRTDPACVAEPSKTTQAATTDIESRRAS